LLCESIFILQCGWSALTLAFSDNNRQCRFNKLVIGRAINLAILVIKAPAAQCIRARTGALHRAIEGLGGWGHPARDINPGATLWFQVAPSAALYHTA
jgi:hypothetical protein